METAFAIGFFGALFTWMLCKYPFEMFRAFLVIVVPTFAIASVVTLFGWQVLIMLIVGIITAVYLWALVGPE